MSAFSYLEDGVAYISFRGTANFPNILADVYFAPMGRPWRHRGFARCWRRLQRAVESWLIANNPKEIILTGHSLGGAIAQLAAFDLARNWSLASVVCFGAPLIGWKSFSSVYNATPIKDRPETTLGNITTTYVFRSDMWHYILQLAGYQRCGEEIVIDEKGYPAVSEPWFAAALRLTNDVTSRISQYTDAAAATRVSVISTPAYVSGLTAGQFRTQPPPLRLTFQEVAQVATPVVFAIAPFLFIPILVAIPLMAVGSAAHYIRRDYGYHSVRKRYITAMTARMARWIPVTYKEQALNLLAAGNAAAAVPDLTAALKGTQADFPQPLSAEQTRHLTGSLRMERAEALMKLADYSAAIADLTAILNTYAPGPVQISYKPIFDGDPLFELRALQLRAVAYSAAKQIVEAKADFERVLTAKLNDWETYDRSLKKAEQRYGYFAVFYRRKQLYASASEIRNGLEQAFQKEMAAMFQWAHYNAALCALQLRDYEGAVKEASGALELDPADAWAYNLRGVAYGNLKQSADAFKDFDKSVELQPGVAGFYFARAYARSFSADVDVIDPHYTPGKALVNVKIMREDLPEIEKDLKKTLELEPSHELARSLLEGISASSSA